MGKGCENFRRDCRLEHHHFIELIIESIVSVNKKNVLITGAGRGIGRAIATRLTHDGYRVINLDKSAPSSLLEGEEFHCIDVTDSKALSQLIQEFASRVEVVRLVKRRKAGGPAVARVSCSPSLTSPTLCRA